MKYYIGIDLGGTNLAAGLVDENARLIDKQSVPTNLEGGPEELAARMRRLADKVLIKNDLAFNQIESIGVGVPGVPFVNHKIQEKNEKNCAKCLENKAIYKNN